MKHFYAKAIPQQNYKSMREHSEKVMAELDREVAAGFTTKFDDWEAVKATWSEVLVSKLAAIVKVRNDGSERVRIIIDMLRSGLNLFVKLEERIVLPRLRDIIANALWLLSMAENPGQVEQVVTDFSDAFHTIPVCEDERPLQVARGGGNTYVCFDTVVFGGGGSPLIWGRAAAWLARSGQSLFEFWELLIELYVDDPHFSILGEQHKRRRLGMILFL